MPQHDPEWFSNEEFWAATYPSMFPEERFVAATNEIDQIFDLIGDFPAHVLDLACGPGRYAIPLARRGIRVTGVDLSTFLLEKARERASAEEVDVEWVQADMRDYAADPPVDLVLNLFTSFGYFDDDRDNLEVLRNAHSSLRPGGTLVMDVAGKEVLARIFSASSVREAEDGIIVHRRAVTKDWSRIENEWMHVRDSGVRSFRFGHWIYSARELRGMLKEAGFADARIFGNLDGAAYDTEASRLVAVAMRT